MNINKIVKTIIIIISISLIVILSILSMKIPALLNWIGLIIIGIVVLAVVSYREFVKLRLDKLLKEHKKKEKNSSLKEDLVVEPTLDESASSSKEIKTNVVGDEDVKNEKLKKINDLDTWIKRFDSSIIDINKEITKFKSKRTKLINAKKTLNEGVIAYEKEKAEYENYLKINGESLKESKKEFINRIDAFIAESGVNSDI